MTTHTTALIVISALGFASPLACAATSEAPASNQPAAPAMLKPWTGPFGGLPDWQSIKQTEFPAAFAAAMDAQRAEIGRIASAVTKPTFANTIVALERSGDAMNRVSTYFSVHSSVLNVDKMPDIKSEMAPELAAFEDEITQNEPLFKRIAAVYDKRMNSGLTPEQQRLTWVIYTQFVRAGAKLDATQKTRLSAINQRLATLFDDFGQHLLDDEAKPFTLIESAAGLAGLPRDLQDAAARNAEAHGMKGKWAVSNTRSSMEPFLTFAADRGLREKVWRTYYSRGNNNDATDNKKLITEILALRFERARLLGYSSHAHWRVEQQMAAKPENAMALMEAVWLPAVAQVHKDVAEMQKIIDGEGGNFKLAPWDYRYYTEKLRKAKYDLDLNEVKPYLQLDKMRDAMFWAAGQLYGVKFSPAPNIPTYHADVSAWDVTDRAGKHVGLWYFDPYAREGKDSGAWMSEYRSQRKLDKVVTPIVSNNSNFVEGAKGQPVLISWDDTETMFHEFGHALHGLLSNVKYATLAGARTARDFVEFPSQLNEHWLLTPEVLGRFALHFESGKPIPHDLVEKIVRAKTFNQGFKTVEYLAGALVDMKFHLAGAGPIDPAVFERDTLAAMGMPDEIVMRHRPTQFAHIFGGDGYSAGYYAYLWADSLTADTWEAFNAGRHGPWDSVVAARYKKEILSRGNSIDQTVEFRNFRGRDVDTAALMRDRGFAPPLVH
jgi:peptidyl-dipeptidase Dcp